MKLSPISFDWNLSYGGDKRIFQVEVWKNTSRITTEFIQKIIQATGDEPAPDEEYTKSSSVLILMINEAIGRPKYSLLKGTGKYATLINSHDRGFCCIYSNTSVMELSIPDVIKEMSASELLAAERHEDGSVDVTLSHIVGNIVLYLAMFRRTGLSCFTETENQSLSLLEERLEKKVQQDPAFLVTRCLRKRQTFDIASTGSAMDTDIEMFFSSQARLFWEQHMYDAKKLAEKCARVEKKHRMSNERSTRLREYVTEMENLREQICATHAKAKQDMKDLTG